MRLLKKKMQNSELSAVLITKFWEDPFGTIRPFAQEGLMLQGEYAEISIHYPSPRQTHTGPGACPIWHGRQQGQITSLTHTHRHTHATGWPPIISLRLWEEPSCRKSSVNCWVLNPQPSPCRLVLGADLSPDRQQLLRSSLRPSARICKLIWGMKLSHTAAW